MSAENYQSVLMRIAEALDRIAPRRPPSADLHGYEGYIWDSGHKQLTAIKQISAMPLDSLQGIDQQKQILLENTRGFARGLRANNALLWGARGTGKSSVLKAVHGEIRDEGFDIALVEIQREDIADLLELMNILAKCNRQFIIFCDDLAFEQDDMNYKSLKALLEGGLAGKPKNLVFYATSNRRHLLARQMIENERGSAINPSEAVEEKISLSDRFGLWIGFHSVDQDTYLAMINWYIGYYKLPVSLDDISSDALAWAITRGNRSGRTAYQYIINLAMQHDIKI